MSIYEQHRKSFSNVSAYVVLKDGQRVATVAFKFANSVTAYVHWFGVPMVKGRANGGGYDRQSAAVADAASKITMGPDRESETEAVKRISFTIHARKDGGSTWVRSLEDAGFTVLQAV